MTVPVDLRASLSIDRSLPLGVGMQLRGQIEYGVTTGEIARGTRLPSVRELAHALGISPATVSQVYKELRETGLLQSQQGRGTFVSGSLPAAVESESAVTFRSAVEALFTTAERLGYTRTAVAEAVALRAAPSARSAAGLRVLFVGVYPEASEAYAASIRGSLRSGDTIQATTFERFQEDGATVWTAEVYLTIANRAHQLRALLPVAAPVIGLTFIPSQDTRTHLAALPADSRIAAVSNVPDFLPTLQHNVRRYAPHVTDVKALLVDDPDLDRALGSCTAVVYGTGSGEVLGRLPPEITALEFRFEPEARSITRELLPTLEALRPKGTTKEAP